MGVWDAVYDSGPVRALRHQVERGEAAGAWLFSGQGGAGKRAVAVAAAAALNCETAPGEGCGGCRACSRILRLRHPDVHHVVPEGPIIPVDAVRELIVKEAARSPFEGRFKVFVVEEAERMNAHAQNALLKTLEEPQPDTVFMLLTEREEDLLETVRSRCRVVRLEPVPERDIAARLEREGASPERASLAARLSEGDLETARALAFDRSVIERRWLFRGIPGRLRSPRDALEAAAEILAEARDAARTREQLQRREVEELAEALGEGRGTARARTALAKRHRRELRRVEDEVVGEALCSLASFYRDVLAARSGAVDALVNTDLRDDVLSWATSGVSDRALVAAVERCLRTRAALLRNANPQLALEALLCELAAIVPPPRAAAPW